MKWVDLTDLVCCNAYGYRFLVTREFNISTWQVMTNDGEIVAEGKTPRASKSKIRCKEQYDLIRKKLKEQKHVSMD